MSFVVVLILDGDDGAVQRSSQSSGARECGVLCRGCFERIRACQRASVARIWSGYARLAIVETPAPARAAGLRYWSVERALICFACPMVVAFWTQVARG